MVFQVKVALRVRKRKLRSLRDANAEKVRRRKERKKATLPMKTMLQEPNLPIFQPKIPVRDLANLQLVPKYHHHRLLLATFIYRMRREMQAIKVLPTFKK